MCLSDKFSSLGIVGVIGINGQHVDLFALSCRALGRTVEEQMISWFLERKINAIRFVLTSKNENLYNLLAMYRVNILK